MVHQTAARANKPFVTINCAAVPEGLLESQFFGHEKGAFTGAVSRATGKFEQAHNGMLFLDEIGEMSPMLQAKLLRVIEYGEFERVGGEETIHVDVRLITATNRDLDQRVAEGNFRADLFYRINVFPIHLPPLRERYDDILLLTYHFLKQAVERNRRQVNVISDEATLLLQKYPWHGNVRELENSVERAVLLSDGIHLQPKDFPQQLEWLQTQEGKVAATTTPTVRIPISEGIRPLGEVEREAIIDALELTAWNIARAARELGISRNTLYRKIEEHGLETPGTIAEDSNESTPDGGTNQ
jgi:transcriptional regulator with GAF, ATPase, and Fis domain